jgi:hypothetical protein
MYTVFNDMYNILYEPGNIVYLRRLPLFLPRVFFTRLDRLVRLDFLEVPRRLRPPRPKNPRPSSPFFAGGAAGAAAGAAEFAGAGGLAGTALGTTFGGAGATAGAFVGGADIYLV